MKSQVIDIHTSKWQIKISVNTYTTYSFILILIAVPIPYEGDFSDGKSVKYHDQEKLDRIIMKFE